MTEVTAGELMWALDAETDQSIDWPYIDGDIGIIDGALGPVLDWLLENYVVTRRED